MSKSKASVAAFIAFDRRAKYALGAWATYGPGSWPGYVDPESYLEVQAVFYNLAVDRWAKIPQPARQRLEWAGAHARTAVASQFVAAD